ncbi:MAG: FAD-dependent oxidoreductase [Lautropia sp.]
MNTKKIGLLGLVVVLVVGFFALGLDRYFTLAEIKARQASLTAWVGDNPLAAGGSFFAAYVLMAALSLPGALLLTLLGGAVFGLFYGTLLVSFASSLGATLAFLGTRYLFRDAIGARLRRRFPQRYDAIEAGVRREGAFYLFAMRLVPVFPFWAVNLLMGLSSLPARTFYWVSQLGMLAGTIVYVNAGTQLAQIESLKGLVSLPLILSFVALAVLPLVARRVLDAMKARKVYAGWKKPMSFDRNLIVIGAGSGGLVASLIAATVKAQVTLVEKHRMGGDCLNTGCVPSKALLKTAKLMALARDSRVYGIERMDATLDFAAAMQRVQHVVSKVEPHDSVERYRGLGVDVVEGEAKLVSPWEVEIQPRDGGAPKRLAARSIVLATGARPLVPPIPGIEDTGYLTSDTVWARREPMGRLLVLGGGPIGCELALAFSRLGARVTQVEMAPHLLGREDPEVAELIEKRFADEGVVVKLGHKALRFERSGAERTLVAEAQGGEVRIVFDTLLLALGRVANVSGFGLEALGVELTPRKTVAVDEFLQTRFPNIFAVGDVAGPYQFTHTAAHMAYYAAVNALFGSFRRSKVDYSVIPWCTFTDPEVARVGLNETDAKAAGIAYEVTRYGIDDLDRAIADDVDHGFVKVLTVPGKDRILGVTIVGEHAGDLIAEYVLAMRQGLGLNRIMGTIHIYPTLAEANKYAAGEWKKAHKPEKLLEWVGRFHRWRLN